MKRFEAAWVVVAGVSFVAGLPAWGQESPPASPRVEAPPSLPTAKEIIDRFIEATGGRAAYERCTNRVATGTIEVPIQNLKGSSVLTHAAPNKMVMKAEFPGVGTQITGTDGVHAWDWNTVTGARLLEGPERAAHLRQATFNAELHWDDLYKSITMAGLGQTEAGPAYMVRLEAEDGQQSTQYFDKDSGLLVMVEATIRMQMGEVPVVSTISDYKEIDGLLFPHKTVQTVMGMQLITTFDSVRHNVDLPPDAFDPPPEVKQLLGGQGGNAGGQEDKRE